MPVPHSIKDRLKEEYDISIKSETSVSGGSINHAYRIGTTEGDLFLKYNTSAPTDFFKREAEGLKLLKSASTDIRVPDVIAAQSPSAHSAGFLVIEFIESCSSGNAAQFGAALAELHQTNSDQFGLNEDNYIGSLPQSNQRHSSWLSFFSEERIKPQLKMAVNSEKMETKVYEQWERITGKLNGLIPGTKPSLVHGDLWSGNYMYDNGGRAVLIDPAVYYGHPEMDLAFSKMFGGFSREFYSGYESVRPLEDNFDDRVPIYNLYPLLVHVNLFGGHYISQAKSVLNRFS